MARSPSRYPTSTLLLTLRTVHLITKIAAPEVKRDLVLDHRPFLSLIVGIHTLSWLLGFRGTLENAPRSKPSTNSTRFNYQSAPVIFLVDFLERSLVEPSCGDK
jgi:hypothetical protein